MPPHLLGRKTPEFKGFTTITLLHTNSKELLPLSRRNPAAKVTFCRCSHPAAQPESLARSAAAIVKTRDRSGARGLGAGTGREKPRARAARGRPRGGRGAQPEHKAERRLPGHRTSLRPPRAPGARANTMHPGLGRGGSNT